MKRLLIAAIAVVPLTLALAALAEGRTAAPTKITICHKTGSDTFQRITVSSRAVTSPNSNAAKTLGGHMRHTGDAILPGASACPKGAAQTGQTVKLTANLQPVSGATGSGNASIPIRLNKNELCFTLTVTGLTNVTAAHIHRGSSGAIVVPLVAPTNGTSSGCVTVTKTLLQEIATTPGAFYVNVHTQLFPDGQIRGDLTK